MDNNRQQQGGSGSSENTGAGRQEQVEQTGSLSKGEKQDVADEIGERRKEISSIEEMGGRSGRDDASGGSGDRMEGQSTGQETDR